MRLIRKSFPIFLVLILLSMIRPAYSIDIFIDGEKLKLDAGPIIKNGLVFVPLRGIFEKLGAVVQFEKSQKKVTATRGDTKVELILGNRNARINGSICCMFQPPFEKQGRTYVPLRFVSESLGCRVSWHPPTKTVAISTDPEKDPFEGIDLERDLTIEPAPTPTESPKPIKPGINTDFDEIEPIKP